MRFDHDMASAPDRPKWTAERDGLLVRLAASGASLNDAARQLRVTKNAVTGRARRLRVKFAGSVSKGIKAAAARRSETEALRPVTHLIPTTGPEPGATLNAAPAPEQPGAVG